MGQRSYKSLEECVSKLDRGTYTVIKSYKLPLGVDDRISQFDITYFEFGQKEHPRRYLVISKGNLENAVNPYVRINSECMWGRLESAQCDCDWQFKESKRLIDKEGLGMIILGVDQVGKGVGLRVHSLINAEAHLENPEISLYEKDIWYKGFVEHEGKVDYRSFDDVADILAHYNIRNVRLLSNNRDKINALEKYGIGVERVRLEPLTTKYNKTELSIKKEMGGHLLKLEPQWRKTVRKYAVGTLLVLSSSGLSVFGTYLGLQYYRVHKFDDVNIQKIEQYSPDDFKDYLANTPGFMFIDGKSKVKWALIMDYLSMLKKKEILSEEYIKKLEQIYKYGDRDVLEHNMPLVREIIKKHRLLHDVINPTGQ